MGNFHALYNKQVDSVELTTLCGVNEAKMKHI